MSGTVRHIWGWVLVIVGLIGLLMPVMPGWIFLIPGLVILGDYFPWARRLLDWAKEKSQYERWRPGHHRAEEPEAGEKHGDSDRNRT